MEFEVDLRLFDPAFQEEFAEGASGFAPDEFAEIVRGDAQGFRRLLERGIAGKMAVDEEVYIPDVVIRRMLLGGSGGFPPEFEFKQNQFAQKFHLPAQFRGFFLRGLRVFRQMK